MELKDFIKESLGRVNRSNTRTLDGLKQSELNWRPNPEANSIGIILFHQARSEDVFVGRIIKGGKEVWEEGWHEKFHMNAGESGSGFTIEQVQAFVSPELKDIQAYADAVRAQTLQYLQAATPTEFNRVVNMGRMGESPIANVFALIVVHMAQHAGEIAYLRGLQRGMNK